LEEEMHADEVERRRMNRRTIKATTRGGGGEKL